MRDDSDPCDDVPACGLDTLARQAADDALTELREALTRCQAVWPAAGDQEAIQDALNYLTLVARAIADIGAPEDAT